MLQRNPLGFGSPWSVVLWILIDCVFLFLFCFVMVSIFCKEKLHWWAFRNILVCGYKVKYLECRANKHYQAWGIPSFELLVMGVLKISHKLWSFLPLVAFQRLKVIPLVLKTHGLQTQDSRSDLDLTWKPASWGQALIVLEDAMQASKRRYQPIVQPNCDACEPQQ